MVEPFQGSFVLFELQYCDFIGVCVEVVPVEPSVHKLGKPGVRFNIFLNTELVELTEHNATHLLHEGSGKFARAVVFNGAVLL